MSTGREILQMIRIARSLFLRSLQYDRLDFLCALGSHCLLVCGLFHVTFLRTPRHFLVRTELQVLFYFIFVLVSFFFLFFRSVCRQRHERKFFGRKLQLGKWLQLGRRRPGERESHPKSSIVGIQIAEQRTTFICCRSSTENLFERLFRCERCQRTKYSGEKCLVAKCSRAQLCPFILMPYHVRERCACVAHANQKHSKQNRK